MIDDHKLMMGAGRIFTSATALAGGNTARRHDLRRQLMRCFRDRGANQHGERLRSAPRSLSPGSFAQAFSSISLPRLEVPLNLLSAHTELKVFKPFEFTNIDCFGSGALPIALGG
jgi:hypothetical protein